MTQLPEGFPEGTQVPTDEEIAAYKLFCAEQNAYIAEKERLEAERLIALATPLVPLTISGTTVSAVKASADASVKDLANQMQTKLDLLGETSG